MGGGGVEKSRLKLTSAKVEVEVEAELGNTGVSISYDLLFLLYTPCRNKNAFKLNPEKN